MCRAERASAEAGGIRVLIGCCLVTGVLGSIHAYSVLVTPLEARFGMDRGEVSLIYSVALVCLTVAVLTGWRLYHRLRPSRLVGAACVLAAVGLLLSSATTNPGVLMVGYGLMFGTANGIGYGFVLQLSARAGHVRPAAAMALVTASYAVGATAFAFLLARWQSQFGVSVAMLRQAAVITLAGTAAGMILQSTGARYPVQDHKQEATSGRGPEVVRYWLAYGCNVFSGLMAMGHAAGIMLRTGGDSGVATLGAMLIGLGNAAGGLTVAALASRDRSRQMLLAFPAMTMAALVILAMGDSAISSLACLVIIGLAYGGSIAIYPAVVDAVFPDSGAAAYGKVFTAWGVAGLAGPWLAGILFNLSGGYRLPLLVAATFSLLSCAVVAGLPFKPLRKV